MNKSSSPMWWVIGIIVIIVVVIILLTSSPTNNSEDTMPRESSLPTTNQSEQVMEQATKNIVETAIDAGSFTTLVTAVQAAGLVDTLSGAGPFTVFAPTDEAFAKLPAGTVESLLQDPEQLASILTYHVVAGKVMAADVVNLTEATTVQGGTVSIDASDGVKINNATVVTADIETSNGVIHVIDTVLLP